MEYVDCVLLGSSGVGKHELIQSFHQQDIGRASELTLTLNIENKNTDFVVKIVDEEVNSKTRRMMYLKADVIIMCYSTVDLKSFQIVRELWAPEVHLHAPEVPVLLLGTKIDRVPKDMRAKVAFRGEKTSKELAVDIRCIGFKCCSAREGSTVEEILGVAVRSGIAKKRICQRVLFEAKDTNKKRWFNFGGEKKSNGAMTSLLESIDAINGDRLVKSSTSNVYTFTSKAEIVCSLMEDLLDGTFDYSYIDENRDMSVKFSLAECAEAASFLARKMMLYFHFLPLLKESLDLHNAEFLFDVEMFKFGKEFRTKRNIKKLRKEAVRIYQDYIAPRSLKEINIEDDVRHDITLRLKALKDHRVFDLAEIHVISHISAAFKKYVQSSTARAIFAAFKSPFLDTILVDMPETAFREPIGEHLGPYMKHALHVVTLMEFLTSPSASEKRPERVIALTEKEIDRVLQLTVPYLMHFCAFKSHLEKEQSQENLMFWLDVEDFRSLEFVAIEGQSEEHENTVRQQILKRANHIFDRYVVPTAELLVNLPGTLTKQITGSIQELQNMPLNKKDEGAFVKALHMFDGAQREILLLMKRDTWRRFQQDSSCTASLKNSALTLFNHEGFEDPERFKQLEKFQNRFELLEDETLVRTFSCTLERKALLHGQLYVSKRHLAFFNSVFGFKTTLLFPFTDIIDVCKEEDEMMKHKNRNSRVEDLGVVIKTSDGQVLVFKNLCPNRNLLVYSILKAKNRVAHARSTPEVQRPRHKEVENEEINEHMTEQDWELFKHIARPRHFKQDQIVFEENKIVTELYQIARGQCRIEKTLPDGNVVVLRTCVENDIIGEISFIEGTTTSATVIAASEDVEVYVMSRSLIEEALIKNPGLPGRFYKFLATLLADRLRTKKQLVRMTNNRRSAVNMPMGRFCEMFALKDSTSAMLFQWPASVKGASMMMFGNMYLSQNVLCFDSQVLGSSKKIIVPLSDIQTVKETMYHSLVVVLKLQGEYEFFDVDDPQTVRDCILKQTKASIKSGSQFQGVIEDLGRDVDWTLFLNGAELMEYNEGDIIINDGDKTQYVYQVGHGMCHCNKVQEDGSTKTVRVLQPGDLFGEMSFLQGGVASATVVAMQNNTWVYSIEKNFVDSLLNLNAELPGRFYKFLASALSARLRD
eukprot:c10108_g1_i1.p1 GENE.c10108_g1_i1~~c10108_g1_i1.p1  ORF type:complete len:1156 (+),score=342.36 c10108_g1_i1:146-3613(+)